MVGVDGAGSIHALLLRAARLAADGSTPAGAANGYATNSLVKIEFKPVYAEGSEINETNGSGVACVYYKAPPTLLRHDVTVTVCTPDEELEELLGGGTLLTAAGATIGYQEPAPGSEIMPNGISLEAWSRAVINGRPAAVNPFRHWAMPRVHLRRADSSLENAAHMPVFEGYAEVNPLWGNGPWNDWPAGLASDRTIQRIREAALPASAIGYIAVPAQV